MKQLVIAALIIVVLTYAVTYSRYNKTAQTSRNLASHLQHQCEVEAAQQGYTCQGVIVVIK